MESRRSEPDCNGNPTGTPFQRVLGSLLSSSSSRNFQTVFSTHSPPISLQEDILGLRYGILIMVNSGLLNIPFPIQKACQTAILAKSAVGPWRPIAGVSGSLLPACPEAAPTRISLWLPAFGFIFPSP